MLLKEIVSTYYAITRNPNLSEYNITFNRAEIEECNALREATENVKMTNWEHFISTKG